MENKGPVQGEEARESRVPKSPALATHVGWTFVRKDINFRRETSVAAAPGRKSNGACVALLVHPDTFLL